MSRKPEGSNNLLKHKDPIFSCITGSMKAFHSKYGSYHYQSGAKSRQDSIQGGADQAFILSDAANVVLVNDQGD